MVAVFLLNLLGMAVDRDEMDRVLKNFCSMRVKNIFTNPIHYHEFYVNVLISFPNYLNRYLYIVLQQEQNTNSQSNP